jgi:hypothetical protein
MTDDGTSRSGRLQLGLIAAVFLGPLLLAAWLYYGGAFMQPEARSNHGQLLEPILNLTDTLPASELHQRQDGRWVLLFLAPGECGEDCRSGLYTIRQLRLMLGREMDRVARILLHADKALDTVFLANEHQGLITLEDRALSELLITKKPDGLAAGGYYLIDPQGNLVMYFPSGLAPREIVADIKRLLRLSRIG